MKITCAQEILDPLETASGEVIYELIGTGSPGELKPNHSLAQITIPPGKSSSRHYHKQTQETYFILKGEARMEVNGKTFLLVPGKVCYLEPGEIHRIVNQGGVDLVFLAVCAPAWSPEDSLES